MRPRNSWLIPFDGEGARGHFHQVRGRIATITVPDSVVNPTNQVYFFSFSFSALEVDRTRPPIRQSLANHAPQCSLRASLIVHAWRHAVAVAEVKFRQI